MEYEIKIGDIVTLRSGGPDMTVSYIDFDRKRQVSQYIMGNNIVYCLWFTNDGKLENDWFAPEVLMIGTT